MAWLPEVLRFRAYSQGEIAAILGARVGALGVLAPAALQLVAMRAENMGGDLRVAMTMCREPLLRAYMAYARTHALPPLPLPVVPVLLRPSAIPASGVITDEEDEDDEDEDEEDERAATTWARWVTRQRA